MVSSPAWEAPRCQQAGPITPSPAAAWNGCLCRKLFINSLILADAEAYGDKNGAGNQQSRRCVSSPPLPPTSAGPAANEGGSVLPRAASGLVPQQRSCGNLLWQPPCFKPQGGSERLVQPNGTRTFNLEPQREEKAIDQGWPN